MTANQARLLDFLLKAQHFQIPIYQRTYSWTEQHCRQLWEDLIRAGRSSGIKSHFLGAIVFIDKGLSGVTHHAPRQVIDGQQRLTTTMLILEALARRVGDSEPVDGFSSVKIRHRYLIDPNEEGERHYKLLLTQTDKESLKALLQQGSQPAHPSVRIEKNFEFFERQIDSLSEDLAPLCAGLSKLVIVEIALSRELDNPQLIFESLNSTGLDLSQADLIRNYVLMGLEPESQERLYRSFWRPMEEMFGQEAGKHFDGFMRNYLTLKTGQIPKTSAVYEAFKRYAKSPAVNGVEELVQEVHKFAGYFCQMALDKESDIELRDAFRDLRSLKADVAFPFLLELYDDYAQGRFRREDFVEAIRLVEAYLLRRTVCSIPSNSHNRIFAGFQKALRKNHYIDSIRTLFLELPSNRRFPNDEEFKVALIHRDLYNLRVCLYILRRLENYEKQELINVEALTIEHIMPQNENLSTVWQEALGPDWQAVQKTWLHTLGNLTLTGYNALLSDRPFMEKRETVGGFNDSPVTLNKSLRSLEAWNEHTIRKRAECLADLAVKVWARPTQIDIAE